MFGGKSGSATVPSPSILEVRKLGCRGVQPFIQSHTAGSEPIPGGQAKEAGFPAGLVPMDVAPWHSLLLTRAGWTPTGGLQASPFDHVALDVSCQHPSPITSPLALTAPPPPQVPVLKPMDLMVEVSPRRVFANGHTYHINSISVNSDCETYMSADDLRINLWHLAITDRSFSILSCRGAAPPWTPRAGWLPGGRSVGLL